MWRVVSRKQGTHCCYYYCRCCRTAFKAGNGTKMLAVYNLWTKVIPSIFMRPPLSVWKVPSSVALMLTPILYSSFQLIWLTAPNSLTIIGIQPSSLTVGVLPPALVFHIFLISPLLYHNYNYNRCHVFLLYPILSEVSRLVLEFFSSDSGKTRCSSSLLIMAAFPSRVATTGHCEDKKRPFGREGWGAWRLFMEQCLVAKALKTKNFFILLTGIQPLLS